MGRLGIKKALLRRGEVVEALGISQETFHEMIKEGLITPHYYKPNSRALFLRDQIEKLLETWANAEKVA